MNRSGSSPAAASRRLLAVHVIPYDGIGGVEAAARSLPVGDHGPVRFEKCFLTIQGPVKARDGEYHGRYRSVNDLRAYLAAVRWILRRRPDLVIASLWRSCFAVLLVKLLRPRTRAVTFLHLARDVHWADRLLNRLAMRVSTEIWGDSAATLAARVPARLRSRTRVISMRIMTLERSPEAIPEPRFVFWGRLHAQKGLSRALRIVGRIHAVLPAARFDIIGPDGGERTRLERQVEEMGLGEAVRFLGPKSQAEAFEIGRGSCFYLQPSLLEGLAMSVAEAMQLGLVPVVTPVGEIAAYCRDGENAILIDSDEAAAARVLQALEDPSIFHRLSRGAAQSWAGHPLYRDDVLQACRELSRKIGSAVE